MLLLGCGLPGLAGLRRKLKMNIHNINGSMDGFVLDSHGRIPYSPNPEKKVSIT
jgi:hypothetical protein